MENSILFFEGFPYLWQVYFRVIVGENKNFSSFAEGIMADAKVDVNLLQDDECITMMKEFIQNNGELWNEDIHEI